MAHRQDLLRVPDFAGLPFMEANPAGRDAVCGTLLELQQRFLSKTTTDTRFLFSICLGRGLKQLASYLVGNDSFLKLPGDWMRTQSNNPLLWAVIGRQEIPLTEAGANEDFQTYCTPKDVKVIYQSLQERMENVISSKLMLTYEELVYDIISQPILLKKLLAFFKEASINNEYVFYSYG